MCIVCVQLEATLGQPGRRPGVDDEIAQPSYVNACRMGVVASVLTSDLCRVLLPALVDLFALVALVDK